ncbi:MAG: carbonic anhydrase [Pseudomonadota bacterium]
MTHIAPLPAALADRHTTWVSQSFSKTPDRFHNLATEGQFPSAMIISCCDSRVQPTSFFGAKEGDFFVHRNIASLVPPCDPGGPYHGTGAAIEYAVTALKVQHIVVVGHSLCGGVKGCHDMCRGDAPQLEDPASFVGRWVDILRPAYASVADIADEADRLAQLERQAVLLSVQNLTTYPFVQHALETDALTLHGAWISIGKGTMEHFDPDAGQFVPV